MQAGALLLRHLRCPPTLALASLLFPLLQPQVKAQYDSLLQEMAAARHERERWQDQQAAAERQLAAERERFEGFVKTQVGRQGWM